MNHRINSITFGQTFLHTAIRTLFGDIDGGSHTMFNMFHPDGKVNHELKSDPDETTQLYFYFLKLVPHIFLDMIDMKEWRSYSYSLAHNKKEAPGEGLTGVTFILDYAPVNMILQKQEREFGQFAINLCSIIGGVFIIAGLLNSFFIALGNKCKSS